MPARARRSRDL